MNIKDNLKKLIAESLDNEISIEEIIIEVPADKKNGDFSSNVAMKSCKKLNKKPLEIAEIVKNNIKDELIEKIEIAGPGFINFFVNKNYLLENIKKVLGEKENYGKSNIGGSKTVDLEFVSVNPTGVMHLGHTRGACFGDSLGNILSFAGYDVTKEYYINDAGNQMINMAKSIKERYKEICGLPSQMEENFYYGNEIIEIAKKMYEDKQEGYLDADLEVFKKIGLNTFLNKIKEDLLTIGVKFDVWSSEQALRDNGKVERALKKLKDLGYTYEKEGATWLKTSDFGDEKDRVLIKTDNSYTYLVPDIAYHLDKIERGYDYLIDVLGADHHGYIPRLKAAVTMLGQDANKLSVSIVQMVRAIKDKKEYKISKRTGKSITMIDMANEVGVDALRYFFVSKSLDTQMDFDVDLATTKSTENPVYYIQYAHARICSILNSYKVEELTPDYKFETINDESAYNVLSKIYEFKETVEKSATKKEVHLITNYAYELANLFHSYYASEKIITDDEKKTKERIYLINAVKITIANALKLIGVTSPEKM